MQEPQSAGEVCERMGKDQDGFHFYEKIEVNGKGTHPVYRFLRTRTDPAPISWNFSMFLVHKDGTTVERFAANRTPDSITDEIERALAEPAPSC